MISNKVMKKFYEFIGTLCKLISKPAKDKLLHFILGYIIFDYCISTFYRFGLHFILNISFSLFIVSIFIIGKEFVDKKEYNEFDIWDIISSYLGVILKGIALMILVV